VSLHPGDEQSGFIKGRKLLDQLSGRQIPNGTPVLQFTIDFTRFCNVRGKALGEGRGVYKVLVGRPEGKRPLGRPRHRWEDNIKLDLREIGIDGANWIQVAQDRVHWRVFVNTVMNLRVP
jgi:hypothetical protein